MRLLVTLCSFLFISFQTQAECPANKRVPNKHLVVTQSDINVVQGLSLKSGNIWKKLSSKKRALSSFSAKTSNEKSVYLVEGMRKEDLQDLDYVESVQSDCIVEIQSNDSLSSFQNWYLSQVDFSDSSISPKREIIVAISDTGVDINHEDLRDNLWVNNAELNGTNGVDDDNNGYVDDIYGYDFADNDNDPLPSLTSDTDHGTHVAGLVGARYNNSTGILGVTKNNVKIMALKGFSSNRSATLGDLLATIYYAVDNGAHIINASWGVEKSPQGAEQAAVNYAVSNGVAVVAAAGNSSVPASWVVPANLENVITVGSLNSVNQLSTFSNYEDSNNVVDFVAPGGDGSQRRNEALLSTGHGSAYVSLRGTSMSSPLVAGALGYLMSQSTTLSAFQAVFILSQTSDELVLAPYLQSQTSTYNKINIEEALDYLIANEGTLPTIDPDITPVSASGSRTLASSSGSGGCSGSLAPTESLTEQGKLPLVFFFLLPILVILLFKKRII